MLLSLACSAALSAQAQTPAPSRVDVPAGDLVAALDAYARQSGTQLVYRADQLRGARTAGASGDLSPQQALERLLRGSGFSARHDTSGAVVIVQQPVVAQAAPSPAPAAQAAVPPAQPGAQPTELETVQVTGSRIARAQTLLKLPGAQVKRVAAAVGIEDASYFRKVFFKQTGTTVETFLRGQGGGQ